MQYISLNVHDHFGADRDLKMCTKNRNGVFVLGANVYL